MFKTFRPPFIFSTKVEDHKVIKEYMLSKIKNVIEENPKKYYNYKAWNCDGIYTSFPYLEAFLREEQFMKSIVWDPMDEMIEEAKKHDAMMGYPQTSTCSSIWFNYYPPGGFQEVHDHVSSLGSTFAGIYLLHLEEPNTTSFHVNSGNDYLSDTKTTKDVPEGSVIIFPTSLLHYVNPVKTHKYTISFNIRSAFHKPSE